jgi:HEAT repeat protein
MDVLDMMRIPILSFVTLIIIAVAARSETSFQRPLKPGESKTIPLGDLKAGETYRLVVTIESGQIGDTRIRATLRASGAEPLVKELHAGDPDEYLTYRPEYDGPVKLLIESAKVAKAGPLPIKVEWSRLDLPAADRAAIESEPNNSWKQANPLSLGRDVYGSADDVDYLENKTEGKSGLDWFRFEVNELKPILVYFQLDLLDRDVSANLRVYTVDSKTGATRPYLAGKDPMEIVHDRERERYSKHISRVLSAGTYYLEVNANHPGYILRTRVLPLPPYESPEQAVEAGMHYIINVGDAWFAQIPREGNIYVRADNMHDTATRCTACHPSSFSTESNLVAHRNGYPIRSKSNFQYVIDRIANSVTPLYGADGLYWQRFIAIPLQAQGKQGAILADFEREVSGKKTAAFARFGPFLKAAWEARTDLPADEVNGVVPRDSKFGFAWRDWQVLTELAGRTGRAEDRQAADTVARIIGTRAADLRIETLQDRIHRLYAWWLIDKAKFANKIKRETGALLRLQNPDGGWHETDSESGPSAVYTTGQLVYTLLKIGRTKDDPAIDRATRYLLTQQQEFGGWFQTTTHENFRTPMRETRYAVMALAEAFPIKDDARPSRNGRGWANRDEGPARSPRTDSLIHILDDLENLWDVPDADRKRIMADVLTMLDHSEPVVRALAAACLGRIGGAESVDALVRKLNDPSKLVWRSAAWALRRLGNQAIGVEAIKAALASDDPRTRRGATRIFAYQFQGMDEQLDLADRLIGLTDDPDLWTRLQALKTLRQWFYRSGDPAFQRRIIDTYLARMSRPDLAVVRRNLSEGLYIMLDENLGGGVSLQKNIQELPASIRPGIMHAREVVERDVLLSPVLAALESGNALQREAVLDAFDGSFFKGRTYVRQPEGMIDVGNDREFGFLHQMPSVTLDRTFAALLSTRDLPPSSRAKAIALASFFKVPGQTVNPTIQLALLDALDGADVGVQSAARSVVAKDLALIGAETDPARLKRILALLADAHEPEGRSSLLQAMARNSGLSANPEILTAIRSLLARNDALPGALPVLAWSVVSDAEALSVLSQGWSRLSQIPQRRAAFDILFARSSLVDNSEPSEQVVEILRSGVNDPSATIRERTLEGISNLPKLRAGKVSNQLLLSALTDDSPALRKLGMTLADTKIGFWARPDASEFLARLLVDPDAKIRAEALAIVGQDRLIAGNPGLARRVKALAADPALKTRVEKILSTNGYLAESVEADVTFNRPTLLNLGVFRRTVNPLFYQAGEDGYSCSRCHANHTILRIAEADPKKGFSGEQLMINYNSVLKVVNLGEPESSLILRKPRSPQGQGGPDASSQTGLTHVGGPRWESTDHPAYQAILTWLRGAARTVSAGGHDFRISTDSYSPGYEPIRAGDGDLDTYWQTEFVGAAPGYPHELVIDLGIARAIEGMLYVPRQDKSQGRVKNYEVRTSDDGENWSEPLARGSWPNDPAFKYVALGEARKARFIALRGLSEVNGKPYMSAAELVIDTHSDKP